MKQEKKERKKANKRQQYTKTIRNKKKKRKKRKEVLIQFVRGRSPGIFLQEFVTFSKATTIQVYTTPVAHISPCLSISLGKKS